MNSDEENIYKELNKNQENTKRNNDNDDDRVISWKLFDSDLISNIEFIGFDINNSENTNEYTKDVKIHDLYGEINI